MNTKKPFLVSPDKRKRAAEYVKQWRKENTYKVIQNRIEEAIDMASRSGMQDKEILAEVTKAIRKVKRRKNKSGPRKSDIGHDGYTG